MEDHEVLCREESKGNELPVNLCLHLDQARSWLSSP